MTNQATNSITHKYVHFFNHSWSLQLIAKQCCQSFPLGEGSFHPQRIIHETEGIQEPINEKYKNTNDQLSSCYQILQLLNISFLNYFPPQTLLFNMLVSLYFILHFLINSATSVGVPPSWVTNPYAQAGSRRVINNVLTGNAVTPTATITFATAYTIAPHLAYGVADYEGDDSMRSQMFEVNKTTLTTAGFSVLVQISGFTNIWVLGVRYFAISKLFPHHLNSFDNVPVNYNNGALSNVTVASATVVNFYFNVINYTAQATASGYTYRTFSLPLTNCKIVLFITSLFVSGVNDISPPYYPLDLTTSATILTTQTYKLNVTYSIKASMTRLHFSMVIFDEKDVESSYTYQIVYSKINLPTAGGSIPMPAQFFSNTIIGLLQFSTSRTASAIHFNLVFSSTVGAEAINMPASVPRNSSFSPFTRFGFSLFYLKTWACLSNTFFNISSSLCESCPIPNCTTCLNIDKCQVCDTANGYTLKPNATSINLQCTLCDDSSCVACPNRSICITCDQSINYFAQSGSCVLCNISNCLQCENLTSCLTCDGANGYVLNPATSLCIPCTIPNCLHCLNATFCSICDEANGYFFNSTSQQCSLCSIPNCLSCSSLTQCSQCNFQNNYFLTNATNISAQCQLCSIPNCVTCANLATCQVCNQTYNYFSNPSPTGASDQCIECPIANCLWCDNITTCQTCNESNNFFLNLTDFQCHECHLPGCLLCASPASCLTCSNTANYFLNASTLQCELCSIPFCTQCSSLTVCQTCNASANYFKDPSGDQCISCALTGCVTCSSLTQCSICNSTSNYFLNATDFQCNLCSLASCLRCSSLTACRTCDEAANFFLNASTQLCQTCTISNCLVCSSLTTCLVCDAANNYFANPSSGQCQKGAPVCGDNIFISPEQCDDGNFEEGDGCSPSCTIETDWTCEPNSIRGMTNSVCFYTGQITMRVVYIEKVDNANQIEILLEVSPLNAKFWDGVDFPSMVSLSNMTSFDSFSVRRNSDGTVSVLVNYSADIHNMNITVQLDPTKSGNLALSRLSPTSKSFPVTPTDNEAAVLYTDDSYGMSRTVSILAYVIAGLSLFFFLLGIFARKLIGLQMVAVVQISYLSLLTLTSLNPSFKALSNMWFVNGFSYFSLSKDHLKDAFSPLQVKGLSLYSRFTENYNFTLLLIILPYLASLVCFILAKTLYKSNEKKQSRAIKLAKVFACESAFNGVMFSGYIIAVSFALQVVYGSKNMAGFIGVFSIVQCCVLLLLYAVYFVLIINFSQHFGQFVYYFKKQNDFRKKDEQKGSFCKILCQKWYNILMVERVVIGICLVFLLQIEMSPLVTIVLFLLLGVFVLVQRPYLKQHHNYRFACNMLICIAIQGIYLGYKRATFQDQNKKPLWFMMPILVCVLLLICIIYNAIALIYEMVKKPMNNLKGCLAEQAYMTNEIKRQIINMSLPTNPLVESNYMSISPETMIHSQEKRKVDLEKLRQNIRYETTTKVYEMTNIADFDDEFTFYMDELKQL